MAGKLLNFVPTLFVGLGGTGQRVVSRVKERMNAMFPDVPDLPVHYLVMDTDSQQRVLSSFRPDEYIEISNFDGAAVLNRLDRYPMIQQWWPSNLKPADVGNVDFGAGQTRPVGRMAYYYWYTQTIKEAIERKAKELTTVRSASELQALEDRGIALESNTVGVYLVSSLSGGTGSGLFLDVAFEIRNHLKLRKGLELIGIFTMPEGYMRVVPKGLQVERVQANTYAALKEVDHFLDADNAKKVTLQYASSARPFQPDGPLFDSVSLLDIIDAQGNELERVDQLYAMIAAKLTLEMFVAGERRSVMRNIRIRREIVLGRRRHYDSFGVGALVFHAAHAAQYGRLRLAEEMLGRLTAPQDVRADIKSFLRVNELEEHGADLLLNRFRRFTSGRLEPLLKPEPDDVEKALIEADRIMEAVRKEVDAIKKQLKKAILDVRKKASDALTAEIRDRLSQPTVSVHALAEFARLIRAYVSDTLTVEMEVEKKQLDADNKKGRMEEALIQLKRAAEGIWLPMLKNRNIRVRFRRWWSNMKFWLDGLTESLVRTAAQQIYADFAKTARAWHEKLKALEDLMAHATFEAHGRAEQVLQEIQREIEGSFKLIEGVVDAKPLPGEGEKQTRYDKIVAEFKPDPAMRIDDLLKHTRNLEDLMGETAPREPAALLDAVVLPRLEKDFRKIHEVDILTAVEKWNREFDVKRALTNIVRQCRPFLSVDKEALGEERRPESVFFVGVPDTEDPNYTRLLTEEVLGTKIQAVSTGDRSRIIVMALEIGYPSHILTFLRDYKHYYGQFNERAARGEPEFVHLHKDWVGKALPDLIPPE